MTGTANFTHILPWTATFLQERRGVFPFVVTVVASFDLICQTNLIENVVSYMDPFAVVYSILTQIFCTAISYITIKYHKHFMKPDFIIL